MIDKDRRAQFHAELAKGVRQHDRARILRKHIEQRQEANPPVLKPLPPKRTEQRDHLDRSRELGGMRRFMGTMKVFFR